MARLDPFASPIHDRPTKMQSLFLDSSPDFGPVKSETNKVRAIGEITSMTAPVVPQTGFRERSQRLRNLEDDKNALIDDLIRQLETNQHQLQQLRLDYEREMKYNRENQITEDALQDEMAAIRTLLDRNNYVTALINGDALTFPKELWSRGEQGGLEAVEALRDSLKSFSRDSLPHLDTINIHAKLFLNVRSLADTLLRLKFVDNFAMVESFLRGLMSSDLLFDVFDTSLTKTLTCQKIRESYHHDFVNVHCHQIFLATLSSDDLSSLLDESPDIPVHERVTLLEPKNMSMADKFSQEVQSIKMDTLLMKLPSETPSRQPPPAKMATPVLARIESTSSTRTMNTGPSSSLSTPVLSWAAMTAQPFVPRPGEDRSATSTPLSLRSPPLAKALPLKSVARNKHGQRVDKVDDSIPYQELQRIKKMKLCNIYYLTGKNACDGSCNHSHTYPLKSHEKSILKEVARMTPCYYKLECDDPECIYGHRCPQSKPGRNDCFYKQDCRFTGWGHGIDDKVVKVQNVK
ncbi:hypothetical protein LTS08_006436 [Lithohypha guttulata]|nr:hypothetical protein LTS08_006436 [Lithohypha guttulata]